MKRRSVRRKAAEQRADVSVTVRFTRGDVESIRRHARKRKMSVSEYVRAAVAYGVWRET